MALEKVD